MNNLDVAIDKLLSFATHTQDQVKLLYQEDSKSNLQSIWYTSNKVRRTWKYSNKFPLSTIFEEESNNSNEPNVAIHESLTLPNKDLPISLSITRTKT